MFSINESIFVTENPNGAANSGIVIGRKGVMMIDSTFFPSKAERIVDFVSRLTSKILLYVVNTHYHLDHTLGNFAIDAPVVGSSLTKEYLERFDFESFVSNLEPMIRRELEGTSLVSPSVTFKNRIKFDLGDRQIEITRVGGHTPDSSVVNVWPDGVCFCGDLLFSGYHAEIETNSDLGRWIQQLRKLKEKPIKWFVPGHGPVGDARAVDDMIVYLEKFKSLSSMLKLKKIEEIVDKFGEDPVFSERGFALLFEESLANYLRRDRIGKNTGADKA